MFPRKRSHGKGKFSTAQQSFLKLPGLLLQRFQAGDGLLHIVHRLTGVAGEGQAADVKNSPVCSPEWKKEAPRTDCSAENVLSPLPAFLRGGEEVCRGLLMRMLLSTARRQTLRPSPGAAPPRFGVLRYGAGNGAGGKDAQHLPEHPPQPCTSCNPFSQCLP